MDENEREAFQLAVHRRRYKRSPCDSFTFLFYSKISTASVDPGYAPDPHGYALLLLYRRVVCSRVELSAEALEVYKSKHKY